MQEKETKYKGGIMAFVPSHSSAARFPNLRSKATKWDSVRCLALCATRAFLDGGCLGKTVQMIATMAMNMPGPDENNRTSLVVVPAALLYQVAPMLPDPRASIHSSNLCSGMMNWNPKRTTSSAYMYIVARRS